MESSRSEKDGNIKEIIIKDIRKFFRLKKSRKRNRSYCN